MMRRALFGLPAAFLGVTSPGDKLRRPQNAPYAQGTPIGVQPGSPSITVAHIIIVSGPGGGVFIYSGVPGPGNPPTAWISNGTTDPYGNALPDGAQMGLAGSGTFAAGNTLITPSGVFEYSGTPALGNLIASDTNLATATATLTDGFGNIAYAGRCSYQANGTATPTVVVQLFNGVVNIGPASAIVGTSGSAPGDMTASAGTVGLSSGLTGGADTAGTISLVSQSSGGRAAPRARISAITEVADWLVLGGQGSTPAGVSGNGTLYAAISGYPKALGTTDGNVYNVGASMHDTFVPQTINSVTAAQIDGLSHNVLSGQRYSYEAFVVYHGNQNAGNPILSLADPNTNTYTSVAAHEEWSVSGSAPVLTNTDLSFIDTTGPTLSGGRFCYTSRGFFQPSANQTFNLFAACTVAADTWVIDAAYLRLEPLT